MSLITIPIAIGELIDKITILEIKTERIGDQRKLENINNELTLLNDTRKTSSIASVDIAEQQQQLKAVNETLWDIEDEIRTKEYRGEFDAHFIELARSVYISNDKRAALKREINEISGSELVEEKSYFDYRRT
ncbi:MAG: hypothetical protein GY807_02525 [Gammaproteobacteria bacterium]|nr:hypothetical protein [Gammaproteobacteria bacterium]